MRTETTALESGDIPVGRVPDAESDRRGVLVVSPSGWQLQRPRRRTHRGDWLGGAAALTPVLPHLDDLHGLDICGDGGPAGPPAAAGAALTPFVERAIARGTVITHQLGTDLPRALREIAGRPGDLAFDLAAVAQRRGVLAPALLARDIPTVTAVVATRRPHLLPRVAAMLAAQTYPSLEVVVVVHGGDQDDPPTVDVGGRSATVLASPEDRSLGHALALGSDAASGTLITKIDDDDHYGPDHVLDLVLAHRYSGATVVGKSTTVVHLEDLDVTVRRVFGTPESFIHRVAGGTILVARDDLRDLGGWADVPRAVDSTLMDAARGAGATIYRPHDLGYVYVRHASTPGVGGHTWAAGAGHFLVSAREQWLGLLELPELGTSPPR